MIQQLLYWITSWFKQKETLAKPEEPQQYKDIECGVSYTYHTNKTVSIEIVLADNTDDNQLQQSEKFAQFLYYTTEPTFRQKVLDNIKEHSKTPDDALFYQNIVFNIAMLEMYHNNQESKKDKDKEPVIRPLSVFNAPN
jgi:hypothetical protein